MNDLSDLLYILTFIGPNSCPYKVNLHCHTLYSDGSLSPSALLNQAAEIGLTNIAITDHHTIRAYDELNICFTQNRNIINHIPRIWSGIEISCLLKNCLVHVIGLGFDLYHKSLVPYITGEAPTGEYLKASSVVNSLHQAGGIAILAHPARYRLPYNELIREASKLGFDGGEAWYDYEHKSTWKPTELICNSIDNQLKSLNMFSTCGTDTHGFDIRLR